MMTQGSLTVDTDTHKTLFPHPCNSEPEKVFEGLEIAEATREELLNNIKRRLTPQPIKIRADIEVTCFDYEGIDAIKTAFKEAEAVSLPEVPIRVKLVAPPLYVMITNALDKQLGIETMEKAIAVLEESIKKNNGNMVTKMSVSYLPPLWRFILYTLDVRWRRTVWTAYSSLLICFIYI